jgi:hypothetical protein
VGADDERNEHAQLPLCRFLSPYHHMMPEASRRGRVHKASCVMQIQFFSSASKHLSSNKSRFPPCPYHIQGLGSTLAGGTPKTIESAKQCDLANPRRVYDPLYPMQQAPTHAELQECPIISSFQRLDVRSSSPLDKLPTGLIARFQDCVRA